MVEGMDMDMDMRVDRTVEGMGREYRLIRLVLLIYTLALVIHRGRYRVFRINLLSFLQGHISNRSLKLMHLAE